MRFWSDDFVFVRRVLTLTGDGLVEYGSGMEPLPDETGKHSHQDNFMLSDELVAEEDYDLSVIYEGWGFDDDPEDEDDDVDAS